METVEIIGYKRANLGKKEAKDARAEGNVPCVLYGNGDQVHFTAPAILFRPLVYSPNAYFVKINVEGEEFDAILQDIQYHPVSETILHADFLILQEDKPVKMEIPVRLMGDAPGVIKGGKLVTKQRKLRVKAFPKDMPDYIEVDVSKLELGKTIKVRDLEVKNYEIIQNPQVSIASVDIPRALRGKKQEEEA